MNRLRRGVLTIALLAALLVLGRLTFVEFQTSRATVRILNRTQGTLRNLEIHASGDWVRLVPAIPPGQGRQIVLDNLPEGEGSIWLRFPDARRDFGLVDYYEAPLRGVAEVVFEGGRVMVRDNIGTPRQIEFHEAASWGY